MCENRERLIGYVYDECDATERRVIEEHLSSCPTCRHEIRGLRGVRQDLLAWAVPDSEPIWRPMPAPRPASPWQAMPAWAMAAAAGVLLAVGALSGAAAHALLPGAPPAVAESVTPLPAPAREVPVALTPADLEALEERMLARVRAEFDERVRTMSTSTAPAAPGPEAAELIRRVNMLTTRQDEMSRLLFGVATQTEGIRRQQTGLEQRNLLLASLVQEQSAAQGGQGGR